MNKVCFVEGSALTPTSFGYQDPISNVWTSKAPQVKSIVNAGGARSFMLGFETGSSATTLCNDNSAKGNHQTPAGTSFSTTTDWLSGHFPAIHSRRLIPTIRPPSTLSNANLTASGTTDLPTLNPTHGSWYFEIGGVSKTWTPPAAFPSAAGDYNFGARAFYKQRNSRTQNVVSSQYARF